MKTIQNLSLMKEAYVVTINNTINLFPSRFDAEAYLEKEKYDELKNEWEQGYITTAELSDMTRYLGKYYMKLTDFVASLNELEAKTTLLNLLMQEIEKNG